MSEKSNKIKKTIKKDSFLTGINYVNKQGFTYLGNDLANCGKISITKNTFFQILKNNTEAQAGKNLIVRMVGKGGIKLKRNGKEFSDQKLTQQVLDLFTDPITGSWRGHRDKYFTNMFCAGQVYGYKGVDGTGSARDMIIDSRYITKTTNDFGIVTGYTYNTGGEFSIEKVSEQITNYDPDFPVYGQSIFQSVVYNALSDEEAQKRNYYFFKNNATPHLFVILKDTIQNPQELKVALDQFKAKYTDPSISGPILSNSDIKDVKGIEQKNSDLQLLELSRFAVAKMGVVYNLNPKLFGWAGNEFGSYTEYEMMAMQGDDIMNSYADYYEDYMMATYKKFVDPKMDFTIEVVNESFMDKTFKNDWANKLVESGVINKFEARQLLGYSVDDIPEEMKEFTIKNDRINVKDLGSIVNTNTNINTP